MELQTINQVAKQYGISTRMMRYYEQIGLIKSIRGTDNAYRFYDEDAIKRLHFIILLRKLRVSVKQITDILNNQNASVAVEIFEQNIRELDEEITSLSTIKSVLARFAEKLREKSNVQVQFDLLNDAAALSVIDSLSFPKNYIKENLSMENLNKSEVKTIQFGKYLWRILEEKDGKALILAENIIGTRSYHNDVIEITWEHCDMRQYLNGSFYESFTPEEQSRILETQVNDRDNPWYGTKCGNPTVDKVFLLSYDEVIKYFGDSGDLQNRQGWTWTDVEGFESGVAVKEGLEFINDQYNNARRVFKADGSISWWWLRSPGGQGQHTTGSVGLLGEIFLCGDDVWMYSREHGKDENGGVRPAMWVKL